MKMRPIRHNPRAGIGLLSQAASPEMARVLEFAPHLYRFSRNALYQWFHSLNLPTGSVAWMPSFHCGMEVRAAVDAGFSPRFYKIRKDLSCDVENLAASLRQQPSPALIIHYFGFAQPGTTEIAALCRQLGAPLLEDCSHALLSRSQGMFLGAAGDAATFSLYKTLGTVDGGALRASNGATVAPAARSRPFVAWGDHWHEFQRHRRDAPDTYETMARTFDLRVVTARERIFHAPWSYGEGISHFSQALIARIDAAQVREKRRHNFKTLHSLLQEVRGYSPVFPELAPEVCPLYLPVFAGRRTNLLLRMQAETIETFIFGMFKHPAMDESCFPESRRLRDEILCLPVHQDLDDSDLGRIAAVLDRTSFQP